MDNKETRNTHMEEAFDIIKDKYGLSKYLELFEKNQEKLLMNKVIQKKVKFYILSIKFFLKYGIIYEIKLL